MVQTELQLDKNQIQEFTLESNSLLDKIARQGAQQMLELALLAEVEQYVSQFTEVVDEDGNRMVVRNGYAKARQVATGAGMLDIQTPRVDDRREGHKFTSSILPPYMRKSPSLEKLIPALYLKGISTGQFKEALSALLGNDAPGLSSTTISNMIKLWQDEFKEWNQRSLEGKKYVYIWADGVYLNVRLGDTDKVCLLVIMGTTEDGRKELIGVHSGYSESKQSWSELLLSLKKRGLKESPKLAVADGALGFWSALEEIYPTCKQQRCWVHKIANILNKMPKKTQDRAKDMIHNIFLSETKQDALECYDEFLEKYQVKYPKACECLSKDKDELFAFFDFPAEHWIHIRTSNVIESVFSGVRHRTKRTKGHGNRETAEAMSWKLVMEAQKHWRRINGYKLIVKIYEGIQFKDGIELKKEAA